MFVRRRQSDPGIGPEHDPKAAVSIHDMTVAYQRRPVLWDLDLDVPRGVLAAVVCTTAGRPSQRPWM